MTSSTGTPVPLPADHRVSETYADRARAQVPAVEAADGVGPDLTGLL
ncbi:hypothetical protein OG596_24295 [Streptomyces sp. NBC_01102]|nr:hypothetical protein OG596_24295 [Streptomyces sp. NBC_01102]